MIQFTKSLEANTKAVTPRELADQERELEPPKSDSGESAGVLPESLQRLWTFISRLVNELEARIDKTDPMVLGRKTTEEIDALDAEVQVSIEKIRNLYDFFWEVTTRELNLKNTDKFCICKGWAVYYTDPICEGCGKRHSKEDIHASMQTIET